MINSTALTPTLSDNIKQCLAKDLTLSLDVYGAPSRRLSLDIKLINTGDSDYFIRPCDFPDSITSDDIEIFGGPDSKSVSCRLDIWRCGGQDNDFTYTLSSDEEISKASVASLKLPANDAVERNDLPLTGSCPGINYATPGTYNITATYWLSLYQDPDLEMKEAGVVVTATTSFELE